MKRLTYIMIAVILCIGCQEKDNIRTPEDIEGSWFGLVGKNPLYGNEQYIRLYLKDNIVELTPHFVSYNGGWIAGTGTYTYDGRDTIKFDIDLGKSYISNEAIKLKHAVVTETTSVYEVGKTVIILKLYYDKINSRGESSETWIWLDRERPDTSQE